MLHVESRISDVDSGCGISNVRCRMAPISFRTKTKKELGQFVKQTYQKGKRRRNVRGKVNSQQDRTLKLIMAAHHLLSGLLVFIEHDSLWIQHKDMQNRQKTCFIWLSSTKYTFIRGGLGNDRQNSWYLLVCRKGLVISSFLPTFLKNWASWNFAKPAKLHSQRKVVGKVVQLNSTSILILTKESFLFC